MHRSRTWQTTITLGRSSHNRTFNISGFKPAVDTLYFSPVDPIYDTNIAGVQQITPSFVFTDLDGPVQFKYAAPRLPFGTLLYWKKNNGPYISWALDTLNGANFVNGDTLTVGIDVSGAMSGTDFSFTLFNNIDTEPCSNTITVLISGFILEEP